MISDIRFNEKQQLSTEILSLQKRVDDFTPELAHKEMRITELESNLQSANSQIDAMSTLCESLKAGSQV